MNNTIHLTENNRATLCKTDTVFHEVIVTRKPRLSNCVVCLSILKRRLRPTDFFAWSEETWNNFIGKKVATAIKGTGEE